MDYPEPGIKLDMLIAEKVLNWYQDWRGGGKRDWWYECGKEGDTNEEPFHLNRFSTDIKAAWDLVEKFQLCIFPFEDGWTAVRMGGNFRYGDKNKAPTAAHAICLAALNITSTENTDFSGIGC